MRSTTEGSVRTAMIFISCRIWCRGADPPRRLFESVVPRRLDSVRTWRGCCRYRSVIQAEGSRRGHFATDFCVYDWRRRRSSDYVPRDIVAIMSRTNLWEAWPVSSCKRRLTGRITSHKSTVTPTRQVPRRWADTDSRFPRDCCISPGRDASSLGPPQHIDESC